MHWRPFLPASFTLSIAGVALLLIFSLGISPAIDAGRFILRSPVSGFDLWTSTVPHTVRVERRAPADWADALAARGHPTELFDAGFGHAHVIVVEDSGMFAGASDPRTVIGACQGA